MTFVDNARFRDDVNRWINREGVGVIEYLIGWSMDRYADERRRGHVGPSDNLTKARLLQAMLCGGWLEERPDFVLIGDENPHWFLSETMSTADCAKQLGCTDRHVRRLVKTGRIQGRLCPDGRWAIQSRSLANARRRKA